MSDLVKIDFDRLGNAADRVVRNLIEYRDDIVQDKNENTRKAYFSDFGLYQRFCDQHHYISLNNDVEGTKIAIKHYINDQIERGLRKTTILRKLCSISHFYAIADLPNPLVSSKVFKEYVKNRLRKLQTNEKQATPFTLGDLKRFNETLDLTKISLRDLRNAAIINVGFDSLLRASNIIDLTVDDLKLGENLVYVKRSKTDQEGLGSYRFVSDFSEALCSAWLQRAGISDGYVFRNVRKSGKFIGQQLSYKGLLQIYKQIGTSIGKKFTCHSTRVGAAVSLYEGGENEGEIMKNGGWKDIKMVNRYTQAAKMKVSGMRRLRDKISK